jgi:hypothetical protein
LGRSASFAAAATELLLPNPAAPPPPPWLARQTRLAGSSRRRRRRTHQLRPIAARPGEHRTKQVNKGTACMHPSSVRHSRLQLPLTSLGLLRWRTCAEPSRRVASRRSSSPFHRTPAAGSGRGGVLLLLLLLLLRTNTAAEGPARRRRRGASSFLTLLLHLSLRRWWISELELWRCWRATCRSHTDPSSLLLLSLSSSSSSSSAPVATPPSLRAVHSRRAIVGSSSSPREDSQPGDTQSVAGSIRNPTEPLKQARRSVAVLDGTLPAVPRRWLPTSTHTRCEKEDLSLWQLHVQVLVVCCRNDSLR